MKTLIVYAHPNPASFNHAIKETVKTVLISKGHEVRVRDLYALNFNPVLSGSDFEAFKKHTIPADIKEEQDNIVWADSLVFIHPIWWIGRPAILQGYIDRVFSYGFAFSYGEKGAQGLLPNSKALVINTAGTPEGIYDQWPGSKSLLMQPTDVGTLGFSGIKNVTHKIYYGIPLTTPEERAAILKEVEELAASF